ncbi:MAG: caspase family protein [Chloroflexi bacterium]|nr:caspase family protein [Chloroflexota bacterium]
MPGMENAHALVVGIANYQHVSPLPPTVIQDARDIRDLLVDPQHCGYVPDHAQILLDQEATGAALRQALADLAARTDPDSTVFFYLSSHGGRVETGPHAGEYILPVDADYASGEFIAQTAISGAEFTAALRAIPARKAVVVLDCCHAGGIGQPKGAAALVVKAGLPESYYDALAAGRGRVILASSRSDEYSYVLPGAANSLFTRHLLAGLRGGIPSDDGLIRIFDLFEYVQPRVTAEKAIQHPLFKAELEDNFAVGLYLGGQKGVVPRDEQGFRYDAYISYVDQEPDAAWVWDTLVPRLEGAGLRVAVSGDVEEPGVARVVSVERGIQQAKRTVIVLSEAYLADHLADFENVLAQTMGIQEGAYRLLPVRIAPIDPHRLPVRLSMLTTLDLAHPRRAEREFDRLVQALRGPLPRR